MSHLHRRWHPFFAWLGLFAMLMVFIGPLVSQSERMLDNHGAAGEPSSAHSHDSHHDQPSMAMHDEGASAVCGYCTLFSHVPGINPVLGLPPTEAVALHYTSATNVSSPLQHARYFRFTPRAPPRVHEFVPMS